MAISSKINASLLFDGQAEEAANFYTSIFKDSKILQIQRYGEAGTEAHGQKPGSVMVVAFELNGCGFTAINGGPLLKFNEAVSFQVNCESQEEVDYFWEKLGEGGDPAKQRCGWLADKFGLAWQVVPRVLVEMIGDPDRAKSQRVFSAMVGMTKMNIAELKKAFDG